MFTGRHVQNVYNKTAFNNPKVEKIQIHINGKMDIL